MTAPILITGGTQRLGLAIAEDLIAQQYDVIVTYRTDKPAVQALADKGATVMHADFSTTQGINDFIIALKQRTQSLRCIIHNASDWAKETGNTDLPQLMTRMMNVHVTAAYLINLAFADCLSSDSGFADIIHMTDYVQERGSKKHIAYAASKAALHNLTLSFSALLAPRVKVNSIAPALVMFNDWDDEEYRRKAMQKSLLEKVPGAKEAVKAVNYLLSSDYVTGQTLHLNGGRHLK